jgi:hypothetical protein
VREKHITPKFRKGGNFRNSFAVLLQRPFFAGALTRGICAPQDRPNCWIEVKLIHGVDVQVGSTRPLSFQSR